MSTTTLLQEPSSNSHWFTNYIALKWGTLKLKIATQETTFCWYLWALSDHVRHWISSWPLNKVCYPCCELQLLFRSHSHVNALSYCSTLVKLVSWKWHFKVHQHLEAKLVHVMNTKVVPFTILNVYIGALTTISYIGHTWLQA